MKNILWHITLDKFLHINFSADSIGNITLHEEYEDLVDLEFTRLKNVSRQNRDFLGKYKNEKLAPLLRLSPEETDTKQEKASLILL